MGLELPLALQRGNGAPLRSQLANELRNAIRDGRLAPRQRLPSSRALATDLDVSRGVVTDAFSQLAAEGYLDQRQGTAPQVRPLSKLEASPAPSRPLPQPSVLELVGTVPDLSLFPRHAWLGALRQSLAEMPDSELDYGDPRGTTVLREELASYLRRVRGVTGGGDRIVVTHGYTQALSLICRVLAHAGATRIGVEDPGDDDQRDVIRSADLSVVPIPVDGDGIVAEDAIAEDTDALVVTPAHQFPTGAILSPDRRAQLAEWASRNGRLLIEDDYDSAYRYDRDPIGTLQGLAPTACIQIGSVSKLLAPTLRLGWMLAPARLIDTIARERWVTDAGHRAIDQRAFAAFIADGGLDRHLRRTRGVYRRRRDLLVEALTGAVPEGEIEGIAAGLHLVLRLPDGVDEEAVCRQLADRRIRLRGIGSYSMTHRQPHPGLVIGYGALTEAAIPSVVRSIAEAVEGARGEGVSP